MSKTKYIFAGMLVLLILIACNSTDKPTGVRDGILKDVKSIYTAVLEHTENDLPIPDQVITDLVYLDRDYTNADSVILSDEEIRLIDSVNNLAGANLMIIEAIEEGDTDAFNEYQKIYEDEASALKPYFD
ncbi:hypothetical protein [Shouchella clausii]|uniref:hypothetical protein n=1 Tax=Shouchella clausii TaxID=79880 RepID=UPI001C737452|nr:hypothetical protein [Shouchella clausii]MBX0320207.1 hypothetical protein [Shouchella clausii]MEB5480779.1 hypothetical protein [Shouchella clausii]